MSQHYVVEVPVESGMVVWACFLGEAERLEEAAAALRDKPEVPHRDYLLASVTKAAERFRLMAESLQQQAEAHRRS